MQGLNCMAYLYVPFKAMAQGITLNYLLSCFFKKVGNVEVLLYLSS